MKQKTITSALLFYVVSALVIFTQCKGEDKAACLQEKKQLTHEIDSLTTLKASMESQQQSIKAAIGDIEQDSVRSQSPEGQRMIDSITTEVDTWTMKVTEVDSAIVMRTTRLGALDCKE